MHLFPLLVSASFVAAGPVQTFPPLSSHREDYLRNGRANACQVGSRTITQDAVNLTQTIAWDIGGVTSSDPVTFCHTVMRMDYGKDWQYAVTDIDWKSHVTTSDSTQITIQLDFNFDQEAKINRFRWPIESGKDEPWKTHMRVPSPIYSACGQNQALAFEWRVNFDSIKGKGGTGVASGSMGSQKKEGGHLKLNLVMKWKRC
ncbi:hypothetical protein EJ08DRAFT_734579 [Tothia fuscella]|uniref:Uncharacterized protein n=1 Tax=Tothia fuscella TaxID=1048955 RepID=A0A9P4NQJ5_9PEZI|nr:hypothetical protein EJ08DRAFT_734579 [Tothia fuscella]